MSGMKHNRFVTYGWVLAALLSVAQVFSGNCRAGQNLQSVKVPNTPVIDGRGTEPVWQDALPINVRDPVADMDISIASVYTADQVFFLVRFPDPDESREHKSWTWDKGRQIYGMGNEREDVFIFKWNMQSKPVDLSIYGDEPYVADIWYWKACRTDPMGYADDKMHTLGATEIHDANVLSSRTGKTMYLVRQEDGGRGAYYINLQVKHAGDKIPRYKHRTPLGSRADVQAKGVWQGGFWTIEFARALHTGNIDDIQFDTDITYQFGVSRYEIAGRKSNPALTQPLFGRGDVGESLSLHFVDSLKGNAP